MLFRLLMASLCLAFISADRINHQDCDDTVTYSENVEMEVSDCTANDQRCILYKGSTYNIVLRFEPKENFTGNLLFKVQGLFPNNLVVPYGKNKRVCPTAQVIDGPQTCESMGGLFSGYRYVFQSEFPISKNYPSVSLHVRFLIQDRRSKRKVSCVEVPVELKEKKA